MSTRRLGQTSHLRATPKDPELRARDQRLESLKSAVGHLAHDVNNLLVPILGYAGLIKEEAGGTASTIVQYAEAIEGAGRKGEGDLAAILLALRPQRRFSPAEFDFSALIQAVVTEWEKDLAPENAITTKLDLAPCLVRGDGQQWANAFRHLLSNARYALALGGVVTISLKRETVSGKEIEDLGLGSADVYKIQIEDTGFGMVSEVARRAFEPFFTTRTQVKAQGLGLTIVHSVVQQHGGQVILSSAEERGTTVTIWVPVVAPTGRYSTPAREIGKNAETKRILLATPDPFVREVLRGWLHPFGSDIHNVQTSREAEETFHKYPGEFCLFVAEELLPDGSGSELLLKIRREDDLPLILLSNASASGKERHWGLPSPPHVLVKPFTYATFKETLEREMGSAAGD